MKPTLIVGDLHGKVEVAEAALNSPYNVIFMGDYVDSYDRSKEDEIKTLDLVLEAANKYPDRVQALIGNHELSYLDPDMRCSGWSPEVQHAISQRDLSVLKEFIWLRNYLISHAGVNQNLLEDLNMSLQDYLESENFKQIGYARGGPKPNGGLFWNDFFLEMEPIIGVPQIVGHSGWRPNEYRNQGIIKEGNVYNVDALDKTKEFLLIKKDKDPKIITLEELNSGNSDK